MEKKSDFNNHKKLAHLLKGLYEKDVVLESNHLSKLKLLEFFVNEFVDYCHTKNPTFQKFFQCLYFTGSYFEGLRVREATEFDIDVVFFIPEDVKYKIVELEDPLSFATLQLSDEELTFDQNSDFTSFIDKEKYFIPKSILRWFQSMADAFVSQFDKPYPGLSAVKRTHSGPARTVKLCWNSVWISVDLVPVISFDPSLLKKCTFQHIAGFSEEYLKFCFLVPKPLKQNMITSMPAEDFDRAWRVHLPEVEKQLILKKGCLQQLIKLLKHLRDLKNWPICSYFIKVIAFWFVKKHPQAQFWKKTNLGYIFLLFLEDMRKHLKNQFLGHILYPKFNLFHSLNKETLLNMQRSIQNFVTKLKDNPKNILRIYEVTILTPKKI